MLKARIEDYGVRERRTGIQSWRRSHLVSQALTADTSFFSAVEYTLLSGSYALTLATFGHGTT
jgi:hypothetical protein